MSRPRVAVIGSGLTALATARALETDVEVLLLPSGSAADEVAAADGPLGLPAPVDDDARRHADELLAGVGLPGTARWWGPSGPVGVWIDGTVRRVPAGLATTVPVPLAVIAASRVLSPLGLATLAAGPVRPRRHVPGDRSVASLVDATLGVEVRDRLVAPWVAAATGGDAAELSAESEVPSLWSSRDVAAVAVRGAQVETDPVARGVLTVVGGWSAVLGSLHTALAPRSVDAPLVAVGADAAGPVLRFAGREEPVDAVVVTVPTPQAVQLLADAFPGVARELVGIAHLRVVEVVLDHEVDAVPTSGAVELLQVPPSQGRRIGWVDRWPGDGAGPPPEHVRSRVLLSSQAAQAVGDAGSGDEVVRHVDAELRRALGIRRPAVRSQITTWTVPQRTVGHRARLDRLVHQLDQVPPGLHLGGPALQGIGPAARLHDAGRLAHEVRWQVSAHPRRRSPAAPTSEGDRQDG